MYRLLESTNLGAASVAHIPQLLAHVPLQVTHVPLQVTHELLKVTHVLLWVCLVDSQAPGVVKFLKCTLSMQHFLVSK